YPSWGDRSDIAQAITQFGILGTPSRPQRSIIPFVNGAYSSASNLFSFPYVNFPAASAGSVGQWPAAGNVAAESAVNYLLGATGNVKRSSHLGFTVDSSPAIDYAKTVLTKEGVTKVITGGEDGALYSINTDIKAAAWKNPGYLFNARHLKQGYPSWELALSQN